MDTSKIKTDGVKKSQFRKKTSLITKNILLGNRRTSVRLERETWIGLIEIAKRENCAIHTLCNFLHNNPQPGRSLTSAIRVFIMMYFREAATEQGHKKAHHSVGVTVVQQVMKTSEDMIFSKLKSIVSKAK